MKPRLQLIPLEHIERREARVLLLLRILAGAVLLAGFAWLASG